LIQIKILIGETYRVLGECSEFSLAAFSELLITEERVAERDV
jgi:hypothetical protein